MPLAISLHRIQDMKASWLADGVPFHYKEATLIPLKVLASPVPCKKACSGGLEHSMRLWIMPVVASQLLPDGSSSKPKPPIDGRSPSIHRKVP